MKSLYLSKRNLLTLLSKLERLENGEQSACSLIKAKTNVGKYAQTDEVLVIAVPDKEYYSDQQRDPGHVFYRGEQNIAHVPIYFEP